jgi:hypothetical protein
MPSEKTELKLAYTLSGFGMTAIFNRNEKNSHIIFNTKKPFKKVRHCFANDFMDFPPCTQLKTVVTA